MPAELFIGLMSGTSVDGLDCALIEIDGGGVRLLQTLRQDIPAEVREQIATLSHSGPGEIEQLGTLDRRLGQLFGSAVLALLDEASVSAADISAIGSHGQTIRHRPPSGGHSEAESFSLQIGDPNTIAETTGITTVADFRRRDIAAGGEGAPLAPAFHLGAFGAQGVNRAVINIGGIANASLLAGNSLLAGFDTGPGNTLLDHWIARQQQQPYDRNGDWAASGELIPDLLARLLAHPYLQLRGPRSTGKEAFNLPWLYDLLSGLPDFRPEDVQATLSQFTAQTIATALEHAGLEIAEAYVCGGGAHNGDLMARIDRALPNCKLASTAALGIDPDWVEAATFGWLAWRTLAGLPGNAPEVTGAGGTRVLGAIYPGTNS